MEGFSDDELMVMFSDGNAEAFDLLFGRHSTSVYNFACCLLNDTGRAEEVLQETFLAVVRSAKTYEPKGRFRAWLLRIARNHCLNSIETLRLRHEALRESSLQIVDPPSPLPSAAEQVQADETLAAVREAMALLPARQVVSFFPAMAQKLNGRQRRTFYADNTTDNRFRPARVHPG